MPQLAERYELGAPLGSGGMARVFAAMDRRLQRQVAVKLIREELVTDETARARLLHEARAAATFQHPNAVAVFDVGEDAAGRPFIVMEAVHGETLADHLVRCGPLPAADATAVATALLDALAAAHRRGLVHRDVKPANVLLPADGGVKLSDFGIAKGLESASAGLTAGGQIVGTPAYLSPERAAGHPATARSDLYALGVVLYESLAGAPPFDDTDPVRVATAHQHDPVPPLAEQAPATPPALTETVERALAKSPAERFADAGEMRAALARVATTLDPPSRLAVPATTVTPSGHGGARDTAVIPASLPTGGTRSRHKPVLAVVGGMLTVLAVISLAWWGVGGAEGGRPLEPVQPGDPAEAVGDGPDGSQGDPAAQERDQTPEAGPGAEAGNPSGGGRGDDGDRELGDVDSPGALAAALASDPARAGEAGPELFEALLTLVREEETADHREDAHKLLMDVGAWMRDDELDSAVGRAAVAVLEAHGRPASNQLAEVSGLLADLAADPSGGEERATDLAEDLTELLHEDDPSDRAKDAAELVTDLETWIDDGDIARQRGEQAVAALRPLLDTGRNDDGDDEHEADQNDEPSGRGQGRGRGRGP